MGHPLCYIVVMSEVLHCTLSLTFITASYSLLCSFQTARPAEADALPCALPGNGQRLDWAGCPEVQGCSHASCTNSRGGKPLVSAGAYPMVHLCITTVSSAG